MSIIGHGGYVEFGGKRMTVRAWSLNGAIRNAKQILAALRHATRTERSWLLEELDTMRLRKELVKA